MKNKSMLLVAILSIGLSLTSCSSSDNEGETLAPLTGKWNISQEGTTVGGVEHLVDSPRNQSGCDQDYLDLNLDNTAEEGDYDSTVTACALTTQGGIYSRSHNNLTTVINGVTKVQDIVNLTITQLKLKESSTGAIIVYTRD